MLNLYMDVNVVISTLGNLENGTNVVFTPYKLPNEPNLFVAAKNIREHFM